MVSNRERRKALARAKYQRQQARRTAAQRRARRLQIIGGTVAGVVAVVAVGWGGYLLVTNNGNSPAQTVPSDNFPSLKQPTNPGVTITSLSPGAPTTGSATTAPSTPTAPTSTQITGTSSP